MNECEAQTKINTLCKWFGIELLPYQREMLTRIAMEQKVFCAIPFGTRTADMIALIKEINIMKSNKSEENNMPVQHICNICLYKEVPEKCGGCFFKPLNVPKTKPLLGVTPRYIHDERRLRELRECIANYMQAGLTILPAWVEEYNELIERKGEKRND